MTSSTQYRIDTPEGFDIYFIPLPNGMLRCRVFFESQEMSMNNLNEAMGREGWLMFASKIREIYK